MAVRIQIRQVLPPRLFIYIRYAGFLAGLAQQIAFKNTGNFAETL